MPSIKMFLSEARNITPVNFWDHEYAGNTDDGTKDLKDLFEVKVFDNPKPKQLIQRVLEHGSQKDSIVLDFFAGSGTTGHAVMAQNAADGGQRRFILVQLPEALDSNNSDQKAAADFCKANGKATTIAELTKERLRRAAAKIKDENPLLSGDFGFRAFKLDSSNINAWNPRPSDLAANLEEHAKNLKVDRSPDDILFEILLKLGLDLTVPIVQRDIAGHCVHCVGGGVLIICLSDKIGNEDASPLAFGLASLRHELAPAGECTVVFKDAGFADDVAKTNMSCILEQQGIENVRSI